MEATPRVLIIGASRGIGLEFVTQYRARGCTVVATVRDAAGGQRLRDLGAQALTLDVTDAASVQALSQALQGQTFDVIVLNAGVYGPRTSGLEPPSQAEFDQVMHTNVLGPMQLLPRLGALLAPAGRLAVLSSRMGSIGARTATSGWLYRASKAALNSLLKDTALTLGDQAICVAFHPGWVRTDMGGAQADLDVAESVRDMRGTLAALTPASTGAFLNHDGQPIAW